MINPKIKRTAVISIVTSDIAFVLLFMILIEWNYYTEQIGINIDLPNADSTVEKEAPVMTNTISVREDRMIIFKSETPIDSIQIAEDVTNEQIRRKTNWYFQYVQSRYGNNAEIGVRVFERTLYSDIAAIIYQFSKNGELRLVLIYDIEETEAPGR